MLCSIEYDVVLNYWCLVSLVLMDLSVDLYINWLVWGNNYRNIPYDSWENRWFPVSIFPQVNPLNIHFLLGTCIFLTWSIGIFFSYQRPHITWYAARWCVPSKKTRDTQPENGFRESSAAQGVFVGSISKLIYKPIENVQINYRYL